MDHKDINDNGGVDFLYIVSKKYDSFTKNEKKIADFLLKDRLNFVNLSITKLARKINVSTTTITRFCQKLNYSGYSELKYAIANHPVLPSEDMQITTDDSISNVISTLSTLQVTAVMNTLTHLNPDAVKLAAMIISKAKAINIFAEGGPSSTADYAWQNFFQLGLPVRSFSDVQHALTAALQMQENDVAIFISRTGAAKNMLRAIRIAKEQKAKIIAITSNKSSKISSTSHILLSYDARIENSIRYLHIARMCELAIIGALFNATINYLPSDQRMKHARSSSYAIDINQDE